MATKTAPKPKKALPPASDLFGASRPEWMFDYELPADWRAGCKVDTSKVPYPVVSFRQLPNGAWEATTKRPKLIVNQPDRKVYDDPAADRTGSGRTPVAALEAALEKWNRSPYCQSVRATILVPVAGTEVANG